MNKLLLSATKQVFRDKEAIFWSLVFPVIFIVIFSFFNVGSSANVDLIIVDKSNNGDSRNFISILSQIEGIGINEGFNSTGEAKEALENSEELEFNFYEDGEEKERESRTNAVLIIPENFRFFNNLAENTSNSDVNLEVFYNEADGSQTSPGQIISSILREMATQQILASSGADHPYEIIERGISVNEIKYYDILVPGIICMGIMQSSVIGMASTIATYKEKRVLKRLSATPLPIWKFLLAQVFTHLLITFLQISIMIVLAKFVLGANIYGSIPLLLVLGMSGSFVFLSLGFIASAMSQTARAAESLSQVFTTPMMFLSGVFFERDTLPEIVKIIADYLPLSPLLDAMRQVSLQNRGITDLQSELLMLAVWTVIAFIVASRMFKFREE